MRSEQPKYDDHDMCCCSLCMPNAKEPPPAAHVVNAATINNPPAPPRPTVNDQSVVTRAPPAVSPPQLVHCFIPPPAPMFIVPNNFNCYWPQQQYCCLPYREYTFRGDKRGRPPHDNRCYFKKRRTLMNNS